VQLLAHRDLALGWPPERLAPARAALDIAVLRGQRLKPGLAGLRAALGTAEARTIDNRSPAPLRRIDAARLAEAGALIDRLATALAPLAGALAGEASIHDAARALGDSVAALTERDSAGHAFTERPDGAALYARLDEVVATGGCGLLLAPGDFGALLDALLAGVAIPSRGGGHPRLRIFGLLEARLLSVDLAVLGGLNEGIWPPAARNDVFLNRQMRAELGLDPPERRLGQTAHDFAQGLGAGEVVLTRALRVEGAPSVPARFLQRLSAFCGPHAEPVRARGAAILALARRLDRPDDLAGHGVPRPAPRPPLALRPTRLSVTAIETLYRDPYAIFARDILDLAPLDALAPGFTAADRGNLVHEALHAYMRAAGAGDRHARLLAAGEAAFAPFMDDPEVAGFWWPGYLRIARWLAGWEEARAGDTLRSVAEISGALDLTLGDGSSFRLTGRADRIDLMRDGRLAIIDYKTGMPPGVAEVIAGNAPQLTLEAAMVERGAFKDVPAGEVAELIYLRLSGRGAGGEERAIAPKDQSLQALCQAHLAELVGTLTRYRDPAMGYLSRRMPRKRQIEGDYDHLARVGEWSDTAGAADDDGGEGEA
jgi:ATP-dependent helicase/nuclease subunit B